MANNSFIDGLKTRSEKTSNSVFKSRFSSGHMSYETGDPLASRSSRRNIGRTVDGAVYKKPLKTPEKKTRILKTANISQKIDTAAKSKESGFIKKETRMIEPSRPRSYARDILGIEEDEELEFDSDDLKKSRREAKLAKRKNRKKKRQKLFIFRHKIFSFLIVPITAVALVAFIWGDSIMLKITNGQSGLFDFLRSIVLGPTELKTDENGRTNLLLFGTSGYDMAGTEADGVHDGAQLTDSIMVVSLDQKSKDVAMISLPRDLKTDSCTATGKINELYYCENKDGNNEIGGARILRERVENILGIQIQYYAHLNWMSLIQIVDAIGGITVTVDENINDDWTKTYVKAGVPVNLNGEQALGLARARHGTENGDFTRGASQQKILMAIKDKVVSQHLSVIDLVNLANILGDNVRSDLNADTITAGAKVLANTDISTVRQIPLIGTGNNFFTTGYINGISYVYPIAGTSNYSAIQEYVKSSLLTNPVLLEKAQILVLNGSGVEGIAEKERTELVNSGFKVLNTGNAPSGEYFEKIYLYSLTDKTATKERLETYYNVKALDAAYLPDGVNTAGADFVVILGVGYTVE